MQPSELERLCESPDALLAALQRGAVAYVDVRTPTEFEQGHLPGAHNLPLYEHFDGTKRLNKRFIDAALQLRSRIDLPWVIGCRRGSRSRQALQVLRAVGLDEIAAFRGGWDGQVDEWGRTTAQGLQDCDFAQPNTD
ncbi:MAG TPA: hypothetical protein DCQ06_07985 [Myxococcales bacterium]|nr:hypothetical protein [Myxococcales bacterium]